MGAERSLTEEEVRLREAADRRIHWRRWGPYLSERQWGTVREDYSAEGTAWAYLPHDHARSRAYRWGEDGIAGISDRHQLICFALAMWNGQDSILKERLFGLTGPEGNHGEDVKEYYYYLDCTPTHSYMKYLYKYPQAAFPYATLVEENGRRGRHESEYELLDSGVFADDRYFDVFVEYAKESAEDILIRITVENRGPDFAELHLLPTVWFRNTWSWDPGAARPLLARQQGRADATVIELTQPHYGSRWLLCEGAPELLVTENETNKQRLFGIPNDTRYVKDGIHDYLISGALDAVNPEGRGTKASACYRLAIPAGRRATVRLRLTDNLGRPEAFGASFEKAFAARIADADAFYAGRVGRCHDAETRAVQRQAFAGMLWSKQFYHYDVRRWLTGDPTMPASPSTRREGRNRDWLHLYNADVISMPDKWEYPWYAAWDLAFHCVPLAQVDPEFAKAQLVLLLREWYMHPNGQLPAYEWAFGDVNPPVHAWAAWRVYKIARRIEGRADRRFLERVFHKLLLNFTWWVNRKDADGKNIFQGGFLGLDNIGVFDRSAPLPTGGRLEQADGTAWMGMYCLNMLAMALELAQDNPAYEDVASKFFEHFVRIAQAMNAVGRDGIALWDETDGFYYDVLQLPDGTHRPLKVRSMVGLVPLFAVQTLEPDVVDQLPGFRRRMQWFLENEADFAGHVDESGRSASGGVRRLLSIVNRDRLVRVLRRLLDRDEFLAPYGVRSLSRVHRDHPYELAVDGSAYTVAYEPGESSVDLFGGNSNWRGPVWFPVNFLLIEALQKFHHYYQDELRIECPTGSGRALPLWDVAAALSRRLVSIFQRDAAGQRPVYGDLDTFQNNPHWRDHVLFYEYFHADSGRGVGASHQTGWTGLVAKLIEQGGG
jgi:hypothetical protein